jgi:hypothetical protein
MVKRLSTTPGGKYTGLYTICLIFGPYLSLQLVNPESQAVHASQEVRILWLLKNSWPAWTPAPILARISLQYCRAIRSLRKRGWKIANKVEIVNGRRHGFYRLGTPENLPKQPPTPPPQPDTGKLFPDQPERQHRDDN